MDFSSRSKKLIIEVDGSQHLDQETKDNQRAADLESLGFKVLRFWNDDVLKDTDIVIEVILHAIDGGE